MTEERPIRAEDYGIKGLAGLDGVGYAEITAGEKPIEAFNAIRSFYQLRTKDNKAARDPTVESMFAIGAKELNENGRLTDDLVKIIGAWNFVRGSEIEQTTVGEFESYISKGIGKEHYEEITGGEELEKYRILVSANSTKKIKELETSEDGKKLVKMLSQLEHQVLSLYGMRIRARSELIGILNEKPKS